MFEQVMTIAGREVVDSWRDRRSLISAVAYSLMGPVVVGMVAASVAGQAVPIAMMSVFTMVSAFVGGMNVAMDSIAGERERRSLVPLLMHPVTRMNLLLGKWLAVSAFSAAGLAVNLVGFAVLLGRVPSWQLAICMVPVALLAAALQVWISTVCRGVKEANTYLSMLVFVPMGLGMLLVFSAAGGYGWLRFLPVAGQQLQLETAMRGGELDLAQTLLLMLATAAPAGAALVAAADRLEQDDVVYGG